MVAERQTYQIRRRYLQALLRTEVAVYDGASSGELVGRLSSDIVLINAAMGEKVGNSLMNGSTFVAGMLVGFIKGWQLTLVILARRRRPRARASSLPLGRRRASTGRPAAAPRRAASRSWWRAVR